MLKDAGVEKANVDEIVLVGGSSRIPRVQKLLEDFFAKQLTHKVNPDEAVAVGATILAAQLQDKVLEEHNNNVNAYVGVDDFNI